LEKRIFCTTSPSTVGIKILSRVREYSNALPTQSERIEQGYIEGQKLLNFKGKRYVGRPRKIIQPGMEDIKKREKRFVREIEKMGTYKRLEICH
jgi:hypothetical protein